MINIFEQNSNILDAVIRFALFQSELLETSGLFGGKIGAAILFMNIADIHLISYMKS